MYGNEACSNETRLKYPSEHPPYSPNLSHIILIFWSFEEISQTIRDRLWSLRRSNPNLFLDRIRRSPKQWSGRLHANDDFGPIDHPVFLMWKRCSFMLFAEFAFHLAIILRLRLVNGFHLTRLVRISVYKPSRMIIRKHMVLRWALQASGIYWTKSEKKHLVQSKNWKN